MFLKHYAQKTVQINSQWFDNVYKKKAKKAIQANTELILKLQLRKSFSEENISFIPKSKHITCNFKKNFTKFMVFKDLNLESKAFVKGFLL